MMHFAATRVLTIATGPMLVSNKMTAVRMLAEDWLEKDAEIDRLQEFNTKQAEAIQNQCTIILKLREAAAAVVKEVYAGGVCSILTIDALRIAAGIKAPPADEKFTWHTEDCNFRRCDSCEHLHKCDDAEPAEAAKGGDHA